MAFLRILNVQSELQALAESQFDRITEAVEQGGATALRGYLDCFARFCGYSFTNQLLIFAQSPEATELASFPAWKKRDRTVKKGERGTRIIAPNVRTENQLRFEDSTSPRIYGFKTTYVFDIAQTTPIRPTDLQGQSNPHLSLERLREFVLRSGISLPTLPASADQATQVFYLAKASAQNALGGNSEQAKLSEDRLDSQAQATAYVVTRALGFDGDLGLNLGTLISLEDKRDLRESLSRVSACARWIVTRTANSPTTGATRPSLHRVNRFESGAQLGRTPKQFGGLV